MDIMTRPLEPGLSRPYPHHEPDVAMYAGLQSDYVSCLVIDLTTTIFRESLLYHWLLFIHACIYRSI